MDVPELTHRLDGRYFEIAISLIKRFSGLKDPYFSGATQASVIALMIDNQYDTDTMVGMNTGKGKGLTYMLASYHDSVSGSTIRDITVVLSPYIVVSQGILEKARRIGVSCGYEFNLNGFREWPAVQMATTCPNVVIVAFEFLEPDKRDRFLNWIESNLSRLRRIVIEEVHAIVTDHAFRNCMGMIQIVARYRS